MTPAAAELSLLRSKTAQQLRDRGYDERYVQGYVESFVEGFFEGTAKSVLTVLDQRGIEVSDTTREHVATCRDIETLTPWLTRVGTADSADEIFLEA
ncbi:hypothetical protein ADK38_45780 [Streptomyces varsoviensis]|uniref:Uncharacterized protein n=1 Tax=Streptomyces varsoviensis TaxID=67373 RepID=A0ABR5IRN8_9ACTN|nr:hypothetical protein ADK38_45780 [Streptomyces varsoviensis]